MQKQFEEYLESVQKLRDSDSLSKDETIKHSLVVAKYCVDNPIHEEIQLEIGQWSRGNFGTENRSALNGQCLEELPSLLGMMEEVGELTAVVVKSHQGRKYHDHPETRKNLIVDALADLDVFRCDFGYRSGVWLMDALRKTWDTVKQRSKSSWEQDKQKETDLDTGK